MDLAAILSNTVRLFDGFRPFGDAMLYAAAVTGVDSDVVDCDSTAGCVVRACSRGVRGNGNSHSHGIPMGFPSKWE